MKTHSLQIAQRIEYKSHHGTVRYLGPIDGRGQTEWVGVEWDDAKRGKHSGVYEGRTYFLCKPGGGTFIKQEKLALGGRATLMQAVLRRYTHDALDTSFRDDVMVVGGGLVSIEEREEDRKSQAALERLQSVDVSDMGVASVGYREEWKGVLPQLVELKVANSLFHSVEVVRELLAIFAKLRFLDVSNNVLQMITDHVHEQGDQASQECGLEEVVLNHCKISWQAVDSIITCANRLQILRLHNCALGQLPNSSLTQNLTTIRTLDLDGNNLTWVDIFSHIGKLPNLQEVYLSANSLSDCSPPTQECFLKVKILSLANNKFNDWQIVSWLNSLPCLTNLRIRGNPITATSEDADLRLTWRMRVIGRIEKIKVLDGSSISDDERLLSEKRYTSDEIVDTWKREPFALQKKHPRAEQLRARFGDDGPRGAAHGYTIRADLIRVVLRRKDNKPESQVVRMMPRSIGTHMVAAVARRLMGLRSCHVGIVVGERVDWDEKCDKRLIDWCGDGFEDIYVVVADTCGT